MTTNRFVIGGFSDINTGNRDYGMGVVRVDSRFLESNSIAASWPRHTLVRVSLTEKGKRRKLYAILRAIDPRSVNTPDGKHLLCLEYDDRILLGVEKGHEVQLDLARAGMLGWYRYFRDHPNILVRTYTRYAFMTGVFTAILGAIAWALFRWFGRW